MDEIKGTQLFLIEGWGGRNLECIVAHEKAYPSPAWPPKKSCSLTEMSCVLLCLPLNMLFLTIQKFGDAIGEQQEIAAAIADLAIEIYLGESALLRTKKAIQQGDNAAIMSSLTLVFIHDSLKRMEQQACTAKVSLKPSP